jgi:spore maturation protein CgeB
MSELKGIHFGSYWMGKNDVVYLMAMDLADLCKLHIVDTAIYDQQKSDWFDEDFCYNPKSPVRWLNHENVLTLVQEVKPDFIIVNSGSMSLRPETIEYLREKKVYCIGISLSDPDVFPYNGKVYSSLYDCFYTNAKHSLLYEYSKETNIKLLPFAASPRLHRPLPDIKKEFDIVIVGHARPDRTKIVKELQKNFKVGLFGSGWGSSTVSVHGEDHVKAINSGKMYLSFSKTVAGFTNVKVGLFEAVACRTFLISELFDEMEDYFKYGLEVMGFSKPKELVEIVDFYLRHDNLRKWITENSYNRFLHEHTWHRRWEEVLNAVIKSKSG